MIDFGASGSGYSLSDFGVSGWEDALTAGINQLGNVGVAREQRRAAVRGASAEALQAMRPGNPGFVGSGFLGGPGLLILGGAAILLFALRR